MFREMTAGVTGTVVMNRAVVVAMVMLSAGQMVDFMGDVKRTCRRIPTALHSKAMQRQEHHQQNAENSTHINRFDNHNRLHRKKLSR